MKTTTIILLAIMIVLLVILALSLKFAAPSYVPIPAVFTLPPSPLPSEPFDAVQELTPGTTIGDIEQDVGTLLQEDALLGDIDDQLRQAEQELQQGGL